MKGLEDLSYEKSRAPLKKRSLDKHVHRSLEYALSNAVWTRERKFRQTREGNNPHTCVNSATQTKMKLQNAFIENARSGQESAKRSRLPERFKKKLDVRRSKRVVLNSDRMTICTLKRKWSKYNGRCHSLASLAAQTCMLCFRTPIRPSGCSMFDLKNFTLGSCFRRLFFFCVLQDKW